jgi:protein-disulfide isomerase
MCVRYVSLKHLLITLGVTTGLVQWLIFGSVAAESTLDEPSALTINTPEETLTGNLSVVKPPIDLQSAEMLGDPAAPLVLVEFSDSQCSYASQHARHTFPQVREQYVRTGKLRYAVLDFPSKARPLAFTAAEATHCAGDQGQYWPMRERLFNFQGNLSVEELPYHARALTLNVLRFRQCLKASTFAPQVNAGMAEAAKAQVTGTPTFFLGTLTTDGSLQVLTTLAGALPFTEFQTAIDGVLATLR